MSWITILWSMNAAASLSLAAMYFVVWLHRRKDWSLALFFCSAISVSVIAMMELASMRTTTPEQYLTLLRWAHVPFWMMVVSLVWFVVLYLRAGQLWLAWTFSIVRTVALAINFLTPGNLNFREITGLRKLSWWGAESVSTPMGITNPWTLVGQLSLLLLVIFAADAMLSLWRRGERRSALFLGGGILFFVIVTITQSIMIYWGHAATPFFMSFSYLPIVAAMGYELSKDVLRAGKLNDDLRESQQQMRLAATATHLAIWNWDMVRDEIWVADEGRALYGVAPDERITWARFADTLHADDRDHLQAAVDAARLGQESFSAEYRVVLPDGSARWIEALGKTEYNGGGHAVRMRGVSLDVTARKETEQQVQQHRDELAHLSRVTMLGELSGSLAHELNQPLGAILRNAEAAEMYLQSPNPDLDELREIIADIRKDDQRAGDVIDRLRALLKRQEIQPQPVPLDAVVGEVLALIHADATTRRMRLKSEIPPGLPLVLADRVQLQQVLLNFLLNGMDAMANTADGERTLLVRAAAAGDGFVEAAVTDRGGGIDADRLEHVFEPFFSTKPQGMGLGLAISRTIVLAHGGKLWVENNPDRGATFRFTLPIAMLNGK
jgi:two-component system sensor kinase FixL